jgi:hypothetical protein
VRLPLPRLSWLVAALAVAGCAPVQVKPLSTLPAGVTLERASVSGKYAELLGTFEVPEDVEQYGTWHDYGFWEGRSYKGINDLPRGYWVYVAPTWYIWARQATPAQPAALPAEPNELPDAPPVPSAPTTTSI